MLFGVFIKSGVPADYLTTPNGKGKRRSWGRSTRVRYRTFNLKRWLNFNQKIKNISYSNFQSKLTIFAKLQLGFKRTITYHKKRFLFFKIFKSILKNRNKILTNFNVYNKLDLFFFKNKSISNWTYIKNNFNLKFTNRTKHPNTRLQSAVVVWPHYGHTMIKSLFFNQVFWSKNLIENAARYSVFIRGPRLFAQIGSGTSLKTSPLLVLTATNVALLLNGERKHWLTPLVQLVLFTSLRRSLLAANIFKFNLRLQGAVRGIKSAMNLFLKPLNEVFTHPITNDLIWDISLGPWYSKLTDLEFTEHVIKSVELTPGFIKTDPWVKDGINKLINQGFNVKLKKPKFLYRFLIKEIIVRPGKNYSNPYTHLWKRKLRSLARRQTKRLVKQTRGRFWLGQT